MRRRRLTRRRLTAEEVIEIVKAAEAGHSRTSAEVRLEASRRALAEVGYTPVDYVRATYWLRQGKPAGYRWDAW